MKQTPGGAKSEYQKGPNQVDERTLSRTGRFTPHPCALYNYGFPRHIVADPVLAAIGVLQVFNALVPVLARQAAQVESQQRQGHRTSST